MNVVYPLREGENEELRYSLRSLVNLGATAVWVVGKGPDWLTGVERIPGNSERSKARNVWANIRAACDHVPSPFVVMNDDFYILEPTGVPVRWRCLLTEHIARVGPSPWRASLVNAHRWLTSQGFAEPLSYELHIPFTVEADKMAAVLDLSRSRSVPPQWRTVYGNYWRVGGEQALDVKVGLSATALPDGPFVSSTDRSFRRPLFDGVRERFPDPSPWEA